MNIDQSQTLVLGDPSFEVLWKGLQSTPTKELRRLTQFIGAYASTTMNKTTEIQQLLKEKEDKIMQLEQSLGNEKKRIANQWQEQLIELQNNFNDLKVQHDSDIKV